jgi:hypothetical protein
MFLVSKQKFVVYVFIKLNKLQTFDILEKILLSGESLVYKF